MRKLEQELSIHQREFKSLKNIFEAKIDDLNSQVASHLATIKQRDQEVADLTERLQNALSEISRLEKELSLTGKDLDLEKQIRQKVQGENTEQKANIERLEKISGVNKKKPQSAAPPTKKK